MKTFYCNKEPFTHPKNRRICFFLLTFCLLFLALFSACQKKIDYFDYVSELRDNIFTAETEGYALRIYSVKKESPYAADGIPKEVSARTEIYFLAPEGDKECQISFSVEEKTYGGEMSFDNVKAEYYYSCSLDISELKEFPCKLRYGDSELTLTASSVKNEKTITPKSILNGLEKEESELFSSMTDKYGFAGEIYCRLIFEESAYYYVGIIDRSGNIQAFLINAETGKILAKRQS